MTGQVTEGRPDTFDLPEVERKQSRPDTFTLHGQLHEMKGERDRLLIEVSELREVNRQLTAAAIDKAKFEGAYNALLASGKHEPEQPEQDGTLWWSWLKGRKRKQ